MERDLVSGAQPRRRRAASGRRCSASDATIFLGMAGALSAGGMRLIVAHLIEHRYIDCLVSTGANLYHDLHETRGRRHFIGSPTLDDAALAAERIDRVYDTLRQRGRVLQERRVDRRVRAQARAAAVHDARVPLQARRAPLEGDRQQRHPDGRVSRERADLLPGHRRFVDRHGPLAGAAPRPDRRPHRRHRRHHRVGQHRHPPAAHRDDRARRRHAEELHQPGQRAGRVLRRPRRRPQVRASDRHRRAALRRRQRLEPRGGAELGQAVDRVREGDRPRRRHDRAAAARHARSRRRRSDAARQAQAARVRSVGPRPRRSNGQPLADNTFQES